MRVKRPHRFSSRYQVVSVCIRARKNAVSGPCERARRRSSGYHPGMIEVLLIDDDRRHTELLSSYLSRFDMRVKSGHNAGDGLRLLRSVHPDLVVLDVMLPGKDGFEICREIRRESNVPIIMLTARGDVTDRIVGLEIGADDYLGKPFEPRELVARIKNVLRRARETAAAAAPEVLHFTDLSIDLEARRVSLRGEDVDLTTMEYELLTFLAINAGRKMSRDEILARLRGINTDILTRSVDIMISRLRGKLGDTAKPGRFIQTVWGHGYCFVGHAEGAADSDAECD